MKSGGTTKIDVTPSASRLVTSLRDIGYDFPAAVADLVDNSISASATRVDIELVFEGESSYVIIADDGLGMTASGLIEALRFGSRRQYGSTDLGRYGLGLKTASLSQCRRVTVVTRRAPNRRRLSAKTLDLGHIRDSDRWELIDIPSDTKAFRALDWLNDSPGTVVCWEMLDRVLPVGKAEGGGARRRLTNIAKKTSEHLAMVFHRFIEGTTADGREVTITVDGEKVAPWNPFAIDEEARIELPTRRVELVTPSGTGWITFRPTVLPARNLFSSQDAWERMSGPNRWNRQQGLYVYRADRLIQSGGWSGLRSMDEHLKTARAAIDFGTDLDEHFQINVAKMRVMVPADVRTMLEPHITELCHRAQVMYRYDARGEEKKEEETSTGETPATPRGSNDLKNVGASIMSAALASGKAEAFLELIAHLGREDAELVERLGWTL